MYNAAISEDLTVFMKVMVVIHSAAMVLTLMAAAALGFGQGQGTTVGERLLLNEQRIDRVSENVSYLQQLQVPERLTRIETELRQMKEETGRIAQRLETQTTVQGVNLVGILGLGAGQVLVVRRRRKVETEAESGE